MPDERLLLGEIVVAHGIKGLVKIRSFTQTPEDILAYGALRDEAGKVVELALKGPTKGGLLAAVSGTHDRNGAEALKGTRLYVERGVLPELPAREEEFYYADLIGLAVELADGTAFGEVKAVHDFGAGDLLELQPLNSGGGAPKTVPETILVPFDRETVPEIDLVNRRLVFVAPVEDDGGEDAGDEDDWAC